MMVASFDMLEGWTDLSLQSAAKIVYPKLRAETDNGKAFVPLALVLAPTDRELLVAWFASKRSAGIKRAARSLDPLTVCSTAAGGTDDHTVATRAVVGLLLLALSTFVAAESLSEGTLWPGVRRAVGTDVESGLFGPNGLNEEARDALDAATRTFGLPSARLDGDAQRYYQTVRFNTGASKAEIPQLASWISSGQGAPRWFHRWRERVPPFEELVQELARREPRAQTLERLARRFFPGLAVAAADFLSPPSTHVGAHLVPERESGEIGEPLRLACSQTGQHGLAIAYLSPVAGSERAPAHVRGAARRWLVRSLTADGKHAAAAEVRAALLATRPIPDQAYLTLLDDALRTADADAAETAVRGLLGCGPLAAEAQRALQRAAAESPRRGAPLTRTEVLHRLADEYRY